jgi:anthranilate phosphoribosyltransferase
MEAMGINVEIEPETVAASICTAGIGLFNGMSARVHPGGLGRILSQIRFGTTFNIAASLANPARPKAALRGVYADSLIDPVAQVMKEIGYQRAMIVHGSIDGITAGMDEFSVCGTTRVKRISADSDSSFDVSPEEVGLPRRTAGEIAATGSLAEESRRFLAVVAGTGRYPGCEDFVALNAGAILWMEGVSPTLSAGVVDARCTLTSGGALEKLRQWSECQADDARSGIMRLQQLEREILHG